MTKPVRGTSTLRTQTLAIIVAATIALVAGICLPLRAVVLSRFEAVEHDLGAQDVERVENALADQMQALGAMARDYAIWDETLAFVSGADPEYVERNFTDDIFVQNRIGFAVALDELGQEVWQQAFDLHEELRSPASDRPLLAPAVEDLVRRSPASSIVSGLARLDGGVAIVGAQRILPTSGEGAARGSLVFGRPLDRPEIARLAQLLRQDLSIWAIDDPDAPPDVVRAAAQLASGTSVVRAIDEQTLVGHAVLDDLLGTPCVVLRVAIPRTVYAQGRAGADALTLSVAIACVLFGLLVLVLLQRFVVRRVSRLGAEVSAVGDAADHSLRVSVEGRDELGKLARDVNEMLDSLESLTSLLSAERNKSEKLLRNILPDPIADRLKDSNETIADSFPEVSVLFADIAGFTELSSRVDATELVVMLNDIFSRFDALAERHALEKIKTIGDAYMIVAGLPEPRADHAQALCSMGLDMLDALEEFNAEHGTTLTIRIGVNTGPVVAGVIGTKKFIYDLWGDAVNIASRMESTGIPGRVQVSESTFALIQGKLGVEARGAIQVKGKGEMRTWLLHERARSTDARAHAA